MKAEMLHSQFADLEEPDGDEALIISIDDSVGGIVDKVLGAGE